MEETKTELERQQETLCSLRKMAGMNRKEFSEEYGIPYRTIEDWEHGKRKMPEYVLRLLAYKVRIDALQKENKKKEARNVQIITDTEGRKIVLINDIRFKGKKREEWKEVEKYLTEYVGNYYEIEESAEKIYIDTDFPDEYANSESRIALKKLVSKAKANASQGIPELIEIATNEVYSPNEKKKHSKDAKFGWYRYYIRFALPVYDDKCEQVIRYNIFSARMLVRHAEDGKKYLYDILALKKETSSPLE
ncbi:MAG: helix-turn-helix transcriptional regulator [Lachnospiraceae bacterium]|nr:helix-turn-helix transcriptional regulator [Lachnospiraceae bacterium]